VWWKYEPNANDSYGSGGGLLVLLLGFAFAPSLAKPSPAVTPERVLVEPARVDLGIVRGTQTLSGQVRLTNDGRTIVKLIDVQSSCECLKPRSHSLSLAAQQSQFFAFVYASDDPAATGALQMELELTWSRGTALEKTIITVLAEVAP
jgi:hypothetical protein